ncbi:hypothetical protein PIB30_014635 [Stylosanthes scabra]|uniref:Uncharacterized protein n=1 Tax=Stylosanthes scabra TaxID=79078 RepID=A0ABU6S721_9FABA|nr:hypothetical protein [Stylosanthes scabra]
MSDLCREVGYDRPVTRKAHMKSWMTLGPSPGFSPPPISVETHQLDSSRQPKLGVDWAHLVLYSPRNIGAVAGKSISEC